MFITENYQMLKRNQIQTSRVVQKIEEESNNISYLLRFFLYFKGLVPITRGHRNGIAEAKNRMI